MRNYFKKATIWYAFFIIFQIAIYLVVEDAKVEELITLAVSTFIIALAMPIIWKIFVFALKICARMMWFFVKFAFTGPGDNRNDKDNDTNGRTCADAEPSFQKQKSSGAAKAALAMSAAALARSSKPSKIPHATSSNGKDKNISCHYRSGNKWLVTYETLHPATGWQPGRHEINPSIVGFTTWGGAINISWR